MNKLERWAFYVGSVVIVVALAWVLRVEQTKLLVVNDTDVPIDYLRLYGDGLRQEIRLEDIDAHDDHLKQLEIKESGSIRIEVIHGLNSLDAQLVADVNALARDKLLLTAGPENSYLLQNNSTD